MNSQLRVYRSRHQIKEMTEQEVAACISESKDDREGPLIGYRANFSKKLSGRTLSLVLDNGGPRVKHVFTDQHHLVWTDENGAEHPAYYEAFETDEEMFLITYLRDTAKPATQITCAVDLKMNLATLLIASMGTKSGVGDSPLYRRQGCARDVSQLIYHGVVQHDGIPTPFAWRHHPTRDLIGKAMGFVYGEDMSCEHIFGSPYSLSWVILNGPMTGMVESAPCKFIKLNEHCYLYTWVANMGSGQQGVSLINMKTMCASGSFFGINRTDRFECYTYGAKAYHLGSYQTKERFQW